MKVKVKIAVSVDETGNWDCSGWSNQVGIEEFVSISRENLKGFYFKTYWLETEIDTPEIETINLKPIEA